ncbi:hypothetical protein CFN78_23730 [Amycolatopsis antarctica]|uniref:Uncharacterized protein n=1 Tax=Amycolatopsis antarctica TaxID=1854586 RepID=A0A263CZ44_9PSEU|nr:hypothetical protein [Amycolatopsis antarctica]OZM70687.1 hypothetical protein CFN78_23730 [Amycolatopsis antarctica]
MTDLHDDVSPAAVVAGMDATDVLSPLLAAAREQTEASGLTVFPDLPEIKASNVVDVFADRMDVAEFVNLAATVGCRLLYVRDERFRAAEVDDAIEEEGDVPDAAALRKAAARFDGNIVRFEVAFWFDGIWHRWQTDAPFHDPLEDLIDNIDNDSNRPRPHHTAEWQLSQEEHDRLVQGLLDDREFLTGPRHRRHRLREEHPLLAPLMEAGPPKSHAVWRIVQEATERVDELREQAARELRTRLPELAQQLGRTTEYRATRTRKLRLQVAAEFLTEHSGGYPMPTALRDEIVELAQQPPDEGNASLF